MRPDSLDSSVGGVVLYEEDIRSQICYLQNLLRDFRRQISSSKRVSESTDPASSIADQPSVVRQLAATAVILINFLGNSAYILWPMFFPLAVYLSEGRTPFFLRMGFVCFSFAFALWVRCSYDLLKQVFRSVTGTLKAIPAKIEENKTVIQKIIYCSQVIFMVTLAIMVVVMTIRCHLVVGHILCVGVSIVFFLVGIGLPYLMKCYSKTLSREPKRQPQSISSLTSRLMAMSFWPSSVESSGSGPVHSSPKHQLFGLLDPISGTTFSPIRGVSCLSPPPTYLQAISYRTLMSPSCRSSLFQ